MEGLTLDTGALVALERNDRRAVLLIESAMRDGRPVVVPVAVVIEWWRGQRRPAAGVLDGIIVEPLFEPLARIAGRALGRVRGPSAVDAVVMASAAQRGDRVLTSDVRDLERLRAVFPGVRVLRV